MDYNKKGYKIALIALIFALIALSISGMPGIDGIDGTNAVLGTLTFSLHNISSDVTEYNSLKMDSVIVADVNKTQRTTIGIPNGVTLIQNWTSLPMNLTLIPAGAISMHIHALKVDGIAHDTKLQYDVGIVNSTGGDFVSVGISDPQVPFLTTLEEEYNLEGVMLEKIINTTDRLALRLYTNQTGTGALPDVTIYMDDLTVSRLTIPAIPIDLTALINQVSTNQINIDTKVNKSGDNMTGSFNMGDNNILGINYTHTKHIIASKTTNPVIPIPDDITGTGSDYIGQFTSENNAASVTFSTYSTSLSHFNVFSAFKFNGTPESYEALGANTNIFFIGARGSTMHNDFSASKATIIIRTVGAWTSASNPTAIDFAITPTGSTTRTTRLTILDTGDIVMSKYAGSGNAYACFDSVGTLYRSATTCV